MIIYAEKCLMQRRQYTGDVSTFDVISKSDISLTKQNFEEQVFQ